MTKKLRVGILNYRENLFDVFLKSFVSLGHEVEVLSLEGKSWSDCEAWLKDRHFDFFLTGNFVAFHGWRHGRAFEQYSAERKVPHAIWHWEKIFFSGNGWLKQRLLDGPLPKNFLFFVTDKTDMTLLKTYGVDSYHLPLAVDDGLRDFRPKPELVSRFSHDVCFSGHPFHLEGVDALDEKSLSRTITVNILLEFYNQLVHHRGVPPPSSDKNPELLKSLNEFVLSIYPNYQTMELALDRVEASWKTLLDPQALGFFRDYRTRIAYVYSYFQLYVYLNRLRRFDIRVYGSDKWNKYIEKYPYTIPRLTEEEFYALVGTSKITFCLTKLQFHSFVHERSMMTLACGGFPITDYRDEIPEMFEKDELVSFKDFKEAEEQIAYYLKHDSERKKIAEKGRQRVLRDHTYSNRVSKLVDHMTQYFGL